MASKTSAPRNSTATNLLDHFYEYLEEDDWLEGVDLYQAGKVEEVSTYQGLVLGKVQTPTRGAADVRLKIHPSAGCIQWIECTCRKNRTKGHYCEHIAALMIHVDREKPEVFARLDTSMPLKPPAGAKKLRLAKNITKEGSNQSERPDATQTIIDHLKGGIQGVSLLAHGPTLRIRVEIKTGSLTHYDLGIDEAAKFLESGENLEFATDEVLGTKVYGTNVEFATRFQQVDSEKIMAERVIAIPIHDHALAVDPETIKIKSISGDYRRVKNADDNDTPPKRFLFVPVKSANRLCGEQFFFLPSRGYWPLDRQEISKAWHELPLTKTFKDDAAATLVQDNFADYLQHGPIFLDKSLQGTLIMESPSLEAIELVDSGDGWFRLDPRYGEGTTSVSMIDLMRQFRKKKRRFLKSGDQWLKIPEFVTAHDWEIDEESQTLKVDSLGLLRLKAAVGEFDHFVGSRHMIDKMRDQLDFKVETAPPTPTGNPLNLRSYQEDGVKWLWWLYQNQLHGLLADEMGLGKTHQAMALMASIRHVNPEARFLVICPTTVLDHWTDKMEQFAPSLKPVKFHGTKRQKLLRNIQTGENVTLVTSYGVLLRDIKHLAKQQWEAFVLDEAHFVKNNDTATYQAACQIPSKLRVCLTGTPMENHLGELKNIFDFLVPGFLGSDDYFRKNFMRNASDQEDSALPQENALQRLIHPFKMRRTKDQVMSELPAKVEDLRHCSLSPEQVKMYREILALKASPLVEKMQDNDNPVPFLHVFATLTLLKQICDHPALLRDGKDWRTSESGKFELLKELLEEALGSGHKVVIYSQYVGMIKIIRAYLDDQNISHVALTGQTRKRGEVIKKFQEDPSCKVFVGSLLAGGVGIDLTAASVVIHYDRWWNASKENQATDRVHRIGQSRGVLVLKLCTKGTLEEKIDRMIAAKQALFEKFLDHDEEAFKKLSRQEMIELLQ